MIAILHADKEWGIGKKNDLMFNLPTDMKFFRETTTGKVVCMGYNTLLSFPNSKPLKNRTNIVLCEDDKNPENCIVVHSVEALLNECKKYKKDEVFIIGGATVYRLMLPYCDAVYLTKVDAIGHADTFFENLDEHPNFELISQSEPINDNGINITFTVYKNNKVLEY